MNFFELFESLIDDVQFVLWWTVFIKLFKVDLNRLRTIPYKWLVIGWIGLLFIGAGLRLIVAMK